MPLVRLAVIEVFLQNAAKTRRSVDKGVQRQQTKDSEESSRLSIKRSLDPSWHSVPKKIVSFVVVAANRVKIAPELIEIQSR